MNSLILQNLCRLSQTLFGPIKPHPSEIDELVHKLTDVFCQVTLKDLYLTPRDLMSAPKWSIVPAAPVNCYVNIFENEYFSLTLFGLRHKNSIIPLHDHPGMNAFMRCVHGSVSVKSYSIFDNENLSIPPEVHKKINRRHHHHIVPAISFEENILSESIPDVCKLSPELKNLHEVQNASDSLAVIADIISPPYHPTTESYFYEFIDKSYDFQLNQQITWLLRTLDVDYFCDTVRYYGPRIKV